MGIFGNKFNVKDSLLASTRELNEMMMDMNKIYNKSGLLNSHIQIAEDQISLNMENKAKKLVDKNEANKAQNAIKEQFKKDSTDLEKMLEELKDSTK